MKFRYLTGVWINYKGKSNEVFEKGFSYYGNFLIFEEATIVHILKGSSKYHHKTFKTNTNNWRIPKYED